METTNLPTFINRFFIRISNSGFPQKTGVLKILSTSAQLWLRAEQQLTHLLLSAIISITPYCLPDTDVSS